MFRRIPPLIIILLLFAIYGFFLQVLTDPVNTLIVVGLSALLFYLVSNYLKTGRFLPAVSKRSPEVKHRASPHRPSAKKPSSPQRKSYPFQVIEGSKGKSKQKKQDEPDSSNNIYQ
jgi:hypothetical protein